jgi:hypothetical protein
MFRSRAALEAEILVLRHQLNVLRRSCPKRATLTSIDRLLLVGLYRLAPGVLDALKIIRPATLLRWHRAGCSAVKRTCDALLEWPRRFSGGDEFYATGAAPIAGVFKTVSVDDRIYRFHSHSAAATARHQQAGKGGEFGSNHGRRSKAKTR